MDGLTRSGTEVIGQVSNPDWLLLYEKDGMPPVTSEEKVFVLGQVNSPGEIMWPDDRTLTLTEAIAHVEGIARLGDPLAVQIRRQTAAGETSVQTVDFNSIVLGDAPDIDLQPGDVVWVPERII
jgi:protein involved in polysaccharide export with SLBB domain